MSEVVLGRAVGCVAAVAAAVTLGGATGPALGKSFAGTASSRRGRLVAAPRAGAGRGCAYENSSVRRTPASDLRSAVVCLINQIRARWHLPPVHSDADIERAAQGHTGQMVAINDLTHLGVGGAGPGTRLTDAGYQWSAFGEMLATGYPTPRQAVDAWLASSDHCSIMLSPLYRAIGVGVVTAAVRGFANVPGTWTADLGLRAGRRAPSGNWGPANSCPH